MTEDKRQFTRILFETTAQLSSSEGSWDTSIIDLSLKGALIQQPGGCQISIGKGCTLEIQLAEDSRISMESVVVHMENNHIGLKCEHIDIDSITHLRRLLELNIGSVDLLNRELSHLG